MNIPAIGAARGIFELFVPGAFVILNAFFVLYSTLNYTARTQILEIAASPVLSLVILICLGYLVGVILRLFKTEIPDKWSARLNRLWIRNARVDYHARVPFRTRWDPKTDYEKNMFKSWAVEDFPYITWTGHTHTFHLDPETPESTDKFHQQVWAPQRSRLQNKTFFNFCKTRINSVDERAASEIYAAEALVRYLVGMFYSLLIAVGLVATGLAIRLALVPADLSWVLFPVLFVVYVAMLLAITVHFRVMRIREVEIVFSATYQHRELFQPQKAQTPAS